MKLREEYKVREMAGEHVVIMQGRCGADMTRIISLNESSLYLWQELQGRPFSVEEAAALLTARYGIDADRALHDAGAWAAMLRDANLLEE